MLASLIQIIYDLTHPDWLLLGIKVTYKKNITKSDDNAKNRNNSIFPQCNYKIVLKLFCIPLDLTSCKVRKQGWSIVLA